MEKQKKKYWMCIIGSTTRDSMQSGADWPMRKAVGKAYQQATGSEDENCWSGWGLTEKRKELIMELWCMQENELPETLNRLIES